MLPTRQQKTWNAAGFETIQRGNMAKGDIRRLLCCPREGTRGNVICEFDLIIESGQKQSQSFSKSALAVFSRLIRSRFSHPSLSAVIILNDADGCILDL